MILSGKEIKKRIDLGDIRIDPFDEKRINPNSYNLRLHNTLYVYTTDPIDMKQKNNTRQITIPTKGYLLTPGKLYLARTVEYTETHNLVPVIEGRSSVGRLGLFVHITAGFGDIGFCGYWTLEMMCVHPIIVYPNIEICQISYHMPYGGEFDSYKSDKYQNNSDVQASKLYKDFK